MSRDREPQTGPLPGFWSSASNLRGRRFPGSLRDAGRFAVQTRSNTTAERRSIGCRANELRIDLKFTISSERPAFLGFIQRANFNMLYRGRLRTASSNIREAYKNANTIGRFRARKSVSARAVH